MRHARKACILGVAALLLAGSAFAQVDFTKYVALGDSLTAGYASAGLAKMYQDHSYPLILSQQFGMATFQQPTISDPGIPQVLELKALNVVNGSIVPTIGLKGTAPGAPTNATFAGIYNNLGVPGAKAGDLLTKTGDITKPATGIIDPDTIMYDLVLRFPVIPGTSTPGTAIAQGIGAAGTFYTVWIGNNDVLGAALSGVALDGVTLTPKATFQAQYTTLLGALRQGRPSAGIVVGTIPDVGAIPFVTTVKPYVTLPTGSRLYLFGEAGQLTDADYVTLGASSLIQAGFGLSPAKPLPEGSIDATGLHAGVILRAAEMAAIRARTAELNTVITGVASTVNAKVFDANAFFADIVANGYIVGGVKLTAAFLTGGMFSYDGVHPQSLGYAVMANEMIRTINAAYGAEVPEVDFRPYFGGAQATTMPLANDTVFSLEAYKSLLKTMAPEALTDRLETRRSVRPRIQRDNDRPDPMAPGQIY
jgi:lysophospholipase L1-like esterase